MKHLTALVLILWATTAFAQQRAADGVTINEEGNPQYSTFSLCAIDPATVLEPSQGDTSHCCACLIPRATPP